ncbi:hypothetical protein YA0720_07590 [Pseudomonas carnis]|nr:hypothetical protein [Pseudomonas carnis]
MKISRFLIVSVIEGMALHKMVSNVLSFVSSFDFCCRAESLLFNISVSGESRKPTAAASSIL